jgi:hypothetical protein
MVHVKILVEIVVIVVTLAVALYLLYTNYGNVSTQFFDFLGEIPIFARGGN